MIFFKPAEETALGPLSWLQAELGVLDGSHRMLMLATRARQPMDYRCWRLAFATSKTVDLQGVGCETDAAPKGAYHAPRVAPAHGLVLSRGENEAPFGMRQRSMVHILADIIFVEPHLA